MFDQEPWHPQFRFNNLFNKHFLQLVFLQKYSVICCVKTVEVEVDCYLKLVGDEDGIKSYFKLVHMMQ